MTNRFKEAVFNPQFYKAMAGIVLFLVLWEVLTAVLVLPRCKLLPNPISVIKQKQGCF